jgi:general stress protein CsbA
MNNKEYYTKEESEAYNIGLIAGALAVVLAMLTLLVASSVSAEFTSPLNNSTLNSSIVELVILPNFSSNETIEDFYYLINNNTDGTERVYPNENYSALIELPDGEHTIYAIYLINGTEYNESVYFTINTTIINVTIPPVVNPPSNGGGSSGGSHACTPEKWNCTEWNECKNGVQYRSCVYNKCKPNTIKPTENITCYVAPIVQEEVKPVITENTNVTTEVPLVTEKKERDYTWLWIIAIILVVVIAAFTIIKYYLEGKRNEEDNYNWTSQPNNGLPSLPSRNE